MPNPYRKDNYFNGGVIYELPSRKDEYELEVSEPYGMENIIVYASTAELGDLDLEDTGSLFVVNDSADGVNLRARGLKMKKKEANNSTTAKVRAAEFFETKLEICTRP